MSGFNPKPAYNVCVARVYQPDITQKGKTRRVFIQVGVAWQGDNAIRAKIDLTLILGPDDELYLFSKDKAQLQTEEVLP